MATLKTKLLLRNDTSANWAANQNVVLSKGEAGIEWVIAPVDQDSDNVKDTVDTTGAAKIKIGDGFTPWKDLPYLVSDSVELTVAGTGYVLTGFEKKVDSGTGAVTYEFTKGVIDAISVGAISDITASGDDAVSLTTTKTEGTSTVVITAKHAENGANTSKGATANVTVTGSSTTAQTIKVPYVTADKFGHVTGLSEKTLSITMPSLSGYVKGTGLTADTIILGSGGSNIKTSSVKIATTVGEGDDTVPTSKAIKTLIAAATNGAVVFKGTLGTNGTITTLPDASTSTVGDAYKVITAGTYGDITAAVGDMVICYQVDSSTYDWILIPSGDDIEDTWRSIQVNGSSRLGGGTSTGALNLANGNGISLGGTGGKVTIGHSNSVTAGTAKGTDTSTLDFADSFSIPSITYDAQGHITEVGTTTITLPDAPTNSEGYSKITPANSTAVTALTGNTTQITAKGDNENVKFSAANK